MKVYEGKVLSLVWVVDNNTGSSSHLFSCGPQGAMTWWDIRIDNDTVQINPIKQFLLPPSQQRWATAVALIPSQDDPDKYGVLCGDRKGSVFLYAAGATSEEMVCGLAHLHYLT